MHRALPLLLVLAVACKPPPDAPEAFSDLCPYLYAHAWDDDPEALALGLEQLSDWLETEHDPSEDKGFQVTPLDEMTMDSLDDRDRTADRMQGLALPTLSRHPVGHSAWALVAVDQDIVFEGTFSDYERTYHSGPDCFVDRSCLHMEAEEHMSSSFAGGMFQSTSHSFNQYRWLDTALGWAMVHRNWLVESPEVNFAWLEVDQQAYLNLFVPTEGGAWRLQGQWTVYDEDNDVPEDTAKNLVVDYFRDSHDDLEAWLDDNPPP